MNVGKNRNTNRKLLVTNFIVNVENRTSTELRFITTENSIVAKNQEDTKSKLRFDTLRFAEYYNQYVAIKDEKYFCMKCSEKMYKKKSHLVRHLRYECGKEPLFICYLCGYKTKRKEHLVQHMSTRKHASRE
ncbi:hypothetical protein BDFB_000082 [Asbolus verrucosus]|uniref:C2H2-type domain-containing protein n=1 Tax=Asbolus verrucosus TaxID=1661398 RepID=A0A482V7L6_ASBVE|nr:hypothetical protein BDFB_000082 [Asbolus verrucosus]